MLLDVEQDVLQYVSRNQTGRVQYYGRRQIGDYLILVEETLVIREAVIEIVRKRTDNVIVKSDSLIAIQAIREISSLKY